MNYSELEQAIENSRQEMIRSLQRLVRHPSVEAAPTAENGTVLPFGKGVAGALDEALQISEELGFRTVNMDYYTGYAEYGEGPEMVAVLGHLDVVPEGEGWNDPPYSGAVHDGKLWGRGAIDDKGPVVEALYALKAIKDLGLPLKRRVRILFGCNEETKDLDMKYYREHGGEIPVMGYTPDANYPLINGEKGIVNETYEKEIGGDENASLRLLSFGGGTAANIVPAKASAEVSAPDDFLFPKAEKITVTKIPNGAKIEAEGTAAHGSMPETGENAAGRLALYLAALPFEGKTKEALSFIAERIGMEVHGEHLGCCIHDDISGYLSMNLGIADLRDGKIFLTLNYRYPVTFSKEDCMPQVRKAFEEGGWTCVSSTHKEKLYVPPDSPLVQTLLGVYREATGDMSAPLSIGGGTYAKTMPNVVAFGTLFADDPVVEHLPNEYIDLDRFVLNAKIQARAILAMAQR